MPCLLVYFSSLLIGVYIGMSIFRARLVKILQSSEFSKEVEKMILNIRAEMEEDQ